MKKNPYYKPSGKQGRNGKLGCGGIVFVAFLWIGFVSVIVSEVIVPANISSVFLDIALFLFLFLPLWIKPVCRLATKGIKLLWAKIKNRKSTVEPIEPSAGWPATSTVVSPYVEVKPISYIPQEKTPTTSPEVQSKSTPKPATDPISTYTDVLLDDAAKVQSELLSIDLMEGHQFEAWCADALRNSGFTNVSVTPGSGDQGVDVLAEKDGIKYAIQCKRYSKDLGNTPIQEIHSGKDLYHRHVGVVLTNQYFTDGARTLADATGTLLWDRHWIIRYLEQKYIFGNSELKHTTPVVSNNTENLAEDDRLDELFNASVEVVLETRIASVSMLQRRLKLGYSRAARIIDQMEERGIVGPFQGSKPRDILITKAQWQYIRNDT